MIIEHASKADYSEVITVLAECGLPASNVDARYMEDFLVARSGRCIVGVAGMIFQGTVAVGHSLAVVPGFRGMGLGRKLADGLLDRVAGLGADSVYLFTCQAEFYFRAMGFSVVSQVDVPESVVEALCTLCEPRVVAAGHILHYSLAPSYISRYQGVPA